MSVCIRCVPNARQGDHADSQRLGPRGELAWFEKLGWQKAWDWGSPATFGGVCAGDAQIFLCLNGQGGRGGSARPMTFGPQSDESAEKGVWMSIWVDDVDAVHARCVEHGLDYRRPAMDVQLDHIFAGV